MSNREVDNSSIIAVLEILVALYSVAESFDPSIAEVTI